MVMYLTVEMTGRVNGFSGYFLTQWSTFMKFHKFSHFFIVLLVCFCLTNNIFGLDADSNDPLIRINYKEAFDQKDIHKKFAELMRALGCAGNVFNKDVNSAASILPDYDPHRPSRIASYLNKAVKYAMNAWSIAKSKVYRNLSNLIKNTDIESDNCQLEQQEPTRGMREAYLDACFSKLQVARRQAIARPIFENGSFILLFIGAAKAIKHYMPEDSMGGSMGVSMVFLETAHLMKEPIRSVCQLVSPPKNDLEELEEHFALNQCLIPKALWPKIIDQFGMARTNKYNQQACIDYLKFALDLTVYAPKPPIAVEIDADNIKQELDHRINEFFINYQITSSPDCDYGDSINTIKIHVNRFVDALLSDSPVINPPKYLYLQGLPGIGKTYFLGKLRDWISELIPNSVHYEDIKDVDTSAKLEGSAETPGAMLSCLRHQLASGKRGSMIIMDDTPCLHNPDMNDVCKRVFNGNQSKISTAYFGNGSEGQGTVIDIPPMLTCVADNRTIEHEPLRTRFAIIHFPMPKKEKLLEYALAKAQQCEMVKKHPIDVDVLRRVIAQWIDDNKIDNFRRADDVETFLNSENAAQAIQRLSRT